MPTRSSYFEDVERAFDEFNPDGELNQIDRICDLAINVGSIALKVGDHD